MATHWKLNTSNPGKFEEFKRLFASYGYFLECTHADIEEIDASPLQVVAHKASFTEESVIVDDTSLEIEGANVGINIKWLLAHLNDYIGKRAVWITYLAYRKGDKVYIFKGSVDGTMTTARGAHGFGFDPYFLPGGSTLSLAESKPDAVNARALAVKALIEQRPDQIVPVIRNWDGPWQQDR